MYLIKGLLIFSPVFLYGLRLHNWTPRREIIATVVFGLFMVAIAFSPFSFRGWFADCVAFSIGATLALKVMMTRWPKGLVMTIRIITSLIFIGYVLLNSLFGPRLIDKYDKGGLTFRLYEIPDLVLFPTYRLRIAQPVGIFEKDIFYSQVKRPGECRYSFDLTKMKLNGGDCE